MAHSRSWVLNIVAPNFEPGVVGGAGDAMVQITQRLLRLHPRVRIFLNQHAASAFPEWREHVVEVKTGMMRGKWLKALAMMRLNFAARGLPYDGLSWFPFGVMVPFDFDGLGVATIHDTLDRDYPDRVPFIERWYRRIMIPRTVKVCSTVTSSSQSQSRIFQHYGTHAEVIPLSAASLPPPAFLQLPDQPYVFYPANFWPHKNHKFLLDTWRREPRLRHIALVFTLSSGVGELASSISDARQAGVRVIVTGRLTRAELAAYYRSALCSVLPSLYEGFGLTVQESLLTGCPVVVSDSAALPETVPARYPYVRQLIPERWTQAVLELERERPADLQQWVNPSTWDTTAAKYLNLFERVVAQSAVKVGGTKD
jgi:glycosyltransferase involved in cell wall biosynthesis